MSCIDKSNKLYYNLTKLVDDESKAKDLYARIMNPEFISDFNIKLGKDGVPNFHDVYTKANLRTIINDDRYIQLLNKDLGAKELKNSQENLNSLSEEVTRFNNSNKMKEFVAVIEKEGENIKSKVVRKTYKTELLSRKIKTNTDLNNFLKSKLSEIGVGVGEITELERRRGIAGVTEFDRAKDATNGIVNLIRISNDEAGIEALPEEFAHFALEAVGESNNLVNRLYNSLDEDVIQSVFGDDYQRYFDEYNGDYDKLRKEAAGKMLAEYIKADYIGGNINLVDRVFEAIKDKFKDLDEESLLKAMIDLDATLSKLSREIMRNDLLKKVGLNNISENNTRLYSIDPAEMFAGLSGFDLDAARESLRNNTDINENKGSAQGITEDEFISRLESFNQNQIIDSTDDIKSNADYSIPDLDDEVFDDFKGMEGFNAEDFKDFDAQDSNFVDFEKLALRNKEASENRINISDLKKQFMEDCEKLKDDLENGGEIEKLKEVFLTIESVLSKRKVINERRGQAKRDKADIYKYSNMLGNVLNFVYQSIETLYNDWDYYERTIPTDANAKCNQLLIFSNTIKSLEYVLNTTDLKNLMSVLTMKFSENSDQNIQNMIDKYIDKLSKSLLTAKNFVQNEELLLTKQFLSDKFGDTFEIPMTLGESQVLTLQDELNNGTQEDVGILTRLFSSLANSPSLILKMVDQIVKRSNDNRRNKVFEERRKIIALGKEYVDSTGSSDFSWFYEKLQNGERSGYYISETNYGEYDKYYKEIVASKKDYWMPDGVFDKAKYIEVMKEFEQVQEEHNDFHNPEWDKLSQSQKDFATKYRILKEQLDDKMFYEIENNKGGFPDNYDLGDFYGGAYKHQKEEEKKRKRSLKTVKIEKSLINKLKSSKTAKDVIKEIGREFKEMFTKTSSDTASDDSGISYLTDFEGKRVYDVPRLFTRKKETESEENMSMDPISTLIAYADASENRYEKLQITGMIDVITDIVNRRKLADKSTGQTLFQKIKTNFGEWSLPIVNNGDQSNISKMLQDYKESQIYGMWNTDMGNIAGTSISKDKVMNMTLSQTALTGMALNVLGGISNVDTGRAMMRIESIAGEHFNLKDVAKADIEYTKNIGGVIADAGELVKTTKLGVFIEQFNVLQEYETEVLHTEFDANRFARCCSEQGLFILNNMGEHYLQTRTALSVAMSTKLKDKDGKEITLWDAMELVDIDSKHPEYGKKIALKEGVTKTDGSEIGDITKYLNKFTHRVQAINQRMHGIYNYEDRCAAQRYAVGRMFYQFRKYIPVSIHRMFGKAQLNFDLDAPTEGYYRTFGKLMLKIYKEAKSQQCSIFNTGVWKNMKDWERKNCIRAIVGMSQTLLIYGAVMITEALMGDQPKQSPWALKLMNYRYRRLYSELAAFTPSLGMINEGLKIIDSPFAACRILDKNISFLEAMKPWNWTEEAIIEQGKYKGKYKGEKAILQMLPVYNAMINIYDPYEATKFYKQ